MNTGWIKLYRSFYSSLIANKPPHYREIFLYLLAKANHKDNKCSGVIIKRGQLFTSYEDICEALHWFLGSKKMRYSKRNVASALKFLRDKKMVKTQKSTRGVTVTICEYDKYQGDGSTEVLQKSYGGSTINKNENNIKIKETISNLKVKNEITEKKQFRTPTIEELSLYFLENKGTKKQAESFFNHYESNGWIIGRVKMKNWKAAARNWILRDFKSIPPNSNQNYMNHDYDKF